VIDAWGVVANSLWVLGLSVLLATLSWSSWASSEEKVRFKAVLRRPGIRRLIDVGLLLFCAGLAATARTWWERILWGALAVAWGVQGWLTGQKKPEANEEGDAD
jgi:hypothetical protein